MLHLSIRLIKTKINNFRYFLRLFQRTHNMRPARLMAVRGGVKVVVLAYFLRRLAAKAASASRESVPVAGSGVGTSLRRKTVPATALLALI